MHASTEINVDEVDSKQQATSNAHVDDSMLAFFKYIPTAYNTIPQDTCPECLRLIELGSMVHVIGWIVF